MWGVYGNVMFPESAAAAAVWNLWTVLLIFHLLQSIPILVCSYLGTIRRSERKMAPQALKLAEQQLVESAKFHVFALFSGPMGRSPAKFGTNITDHKAHHVPKFLGQKVKGQGQIRQFSSKISRFCTFLRFYGAEPHLTWQKYYWS